METITVLLIDKSQETFRRVRDRLSESPHEKFMVDLVTPGECEKRLLSDGFLYDVVLFGEQIPEVQAVRLGRQIRRQGRTMPLIMFTKIRDAEVSAKLARAGFDDMLNLAELRSPLFSWTFMSLVKQAEVRKKAHEFEEIRYTLQVLSKELAAITYDINNLLHVLRLFTYNLEHLAHDHAKRADYINMLNSNITKVEAQIQRLMEIRQRIGEEEAILSKVLSARLGATLKSAAR